MRILLFLLTMTLASCTSVRLAIYDYQKKHAYASKEYKAASAAPTPVAKEKMAKLAFTDKASKYIGSSYCYGSCDPNRGFDCSGFV